MRIAAMSTYKYRAKEGTKNINGVIEARGRDEAIEKIIQSGYVPVSIEEASAQDDAPSRGFRFTFKRIRASEIIVFTRQLSSLIRSGVPILRAISIISRQAENPYLSDLLRAVQSDIQNGASLSSALAKYPKSFSPVYIALVRSGEGSGNLQEVLGRIAQYNQKQQELFSRIRIALAYPVLMGLVGIGTICFMLTFVMPRLIRIFATLGQELPLATRVLIGISSWLRTEWYWILVAAALIFLIMTRGARSKTQRFLMSSLSLKVPIFGDLIRKSELARFSRTLELLIKSGITVLKGIETTTPVLKNEVIKEELYRSYEALKQGGSFGRSLERSKIFPAFMTSLIIIGEESGRLDEAMGEIATSYERDIDAMMRVLTSLLEPLVILFMGLIVGFIVIAMLLPVFQIDILAR